MYIEDSTEVRSDKCKVTTLVSLVSHGRFRFPFPPTLYGKDGPVGRQIFLPFLLKPLVESQRFCVVLIQNVYKTKCAVRLYRHKYRPGSRSTKQALLPNLFSTFYPFYFSRTRVFTTTHLFRFVVCLCPSTLYRK